MMILKTFILTQQATLLIDMPFDWDPNYIDQVDQVHTHIIIPKSFAPFAEGKQLNGYVNGVKVSQRALISDPYSSDETNIHHILLTNAELEKINDSLGSGNHVNKVLTLKLAPSAEIKTISADFYLVDLENFERVPTDVTISYDDSYDTDQGIPFEFTFSNEYEN